MLWGLYNYDINSNCYEILDIKEHQLGSVMLDKCKGRTWTLVRDKVTMTDASGYAAEENREEVETLVWTRIIMSDGMLVFSDIDKK